MRAIRLHIALVLMCCNVLSHAQVTRYTYHDDDEDQLKEVYQVKDTITNTLEGKYISYFLNGNIESQGQFANNETIGTWHFYYETGRRKMTGILKPGSNDGYWKYYYENGTVSMEGEIMDDRRTGEWQVYYESGEVKEKGEFVGNKREGKWLYYFEDGKIRAEADYQQGSGQVTEFYSTGEKRAEGERLGNRNVGRWRYFYPSGEKQAEGIYEHNHKTGEWMYYHHDGSISAKGSFMKGEPEGEWTYFHKNGAVESKGMFESGEKSGYWGVFFENGELKGETTFENGNGLYQEYYPGGKIKIVGPIKKGKSHGLWKYYYEDGKLEGECQFVEGRGEYKGYYPNGILQTKGIIADGKKVGKWDLFNDEGSLSGYYKPIYDDHVLEEDDIKSLQPQRKEYGVADYGYKGKRRGGYFRSRVNEFQGVIVSFDPLTSFIGRVPFAVEFYMQERLGHEFELEGLRDPFFTSDNDVPLNDTFSRGYSIAIKQKFYHDDGRFGLWYFGHELRFTNLSHYANIESTQVPDNEIKVSASEHKVEYSVLLGYRLLRNIDAKGFTIDVYGAAGTGYRSFSVAEEYDEAFDELRQSPMTFRLTLGLNFGYVLSFGKRGS